jgi:hypothetical protein
MPNDKALREQLVKLLSSAEAHADFDAAVNNFPAELRAKKPEGAEHSPWQLLDCAVGHSGICHQRAASIA